MSTVKQQCVKDKDLLEAAWGVIANAGAGNWARESLEWQEAAARWRDQYFQSIETKKQDSKNSNVWTNVPPKPPGQGWYWWRPFPDGVEKVMEIYYTGREGKDMWIMCHTYGEMPISIVLQRWPHSEWSTMPALRPTAPASATGENKEGARNHE